MEKKYIVYKHTVPNGKVYIGITSRKPKYRWNEGKGYINNEYFQRAIRKYGWDNIKHEILSVGLKKEEAEQKEINFIKLYKSTDRMFGYNIKAGGDTCEPSLETRTKMSKSLKGKHAGLFVGGKSPRARKINQYDLEGNFIKMWDSSTDIQRELGVHYSSIIKCCTKKRLSAKGFQWAYANDEFGTHRYVCPQKKPIYQFSLDGYFIKRWESIKQISRTLGIDRGLIRDVCMGNRRHSRGYVWRYAS